ncbi:ABC transporter substrate-binding protein [Kribbia dieselivorans]|uniref:ABC transporter substrate-binding protein n=1 Tax=Kribbia dieselivorans TaxID=331526 RepID=UPI000838D4AA|nr:ABC transporter substrate-binding protein [Kribbia dieselivorans]
MITSKKRLTAGVFAGLAAASLVAGCSTKAADSNSSGTGGSAGGVKTDVGVTDTEISLGALTDQTGLFKVLGAASTQGNQMWADDVNADGGICGRQIKINVSDTGYSAEKAVTLYNQSKSKDLGYVQLIGSPAMAALKKPLVNDKIAAVPLSWSSRNLDVPNVLMVGTTYDVEVINGLAYLQKQGKIKDGDKIGHIYLKTEFGENGVEGSKYYASKHKMTVVESGVSATATDMTSSITALKGAGVKAIVVTSGPTQLASALGVARAQGLNVPFFGSSPTYTPQLLDTPAGALLTSGNFVTAGVVVPFNSAVPKAKEIASKWEKENKDGVPTFGMNLGYAMGMAWGAVLKQACSDGDLTRQGILDAIRKTSVDTQGLTPNQDFTHPGSPATREVFIYKPKKTEGGLDANPEKFISQEAQEYKAPFQE